MKKTGGSFLIEESNYQDIFIVEDFDETSIQMLKATREFVAKEISPKARELENHNYDLVASCFRWQRYCWRNY